ncbi:zf-HC2 domain-containing protein [Streptomyces albus subsp. chlorinus]|uniref:zf-HC2 domain-containing protein n=1 Tax=Streptomyces albus TaxID=1888 RepID=UPI00156EE6AD|nr:zf-HC2 domain-containing protein [Streptomyces albus subsp. chlorinus]
MTPAEHHLGDRLAALVDGELGHDARERVLAHLATCQSCKAEADAQRALKSVFADAAPPPPSEGLLARLQGLPASGGLLPGGMDDHGPLGPGGPGSSSAERDEPGAFSFAELPGGPDRSPWEFDYLPVSGGGRGALAPRHGFRIHETPRPGRPEHLGRAGRPGRLDRTERLDRAERERAERERSASRGRRFAFAAAGAFSLAALALGGTLASGAANGSTGGGDSPSANSVRSTGSAAGSGTARDNRRRGGEHRGALSTRVTSGPTFAPTASHGATAPAARLTAPVSLLQRSAASPLSSLSTLSALHPRRISPATNASGWYGQSDAAGALSALSGKPSPAPGESGRASRHEVRHDPTVLRSFPGRAPLATAPGPVSLSRAGH